MHSQNIDYAAIKDRLKSLQPKNRVETLYAQLAHVREELRNARKRGVSVNTLSAELKAAGITISSGALAKYLSRRSTSSPTKRTTSAATPKYVAEPHGQVKTGTKEPVHGVWGATEQLWNAFHNCSYGKLTNMESALLEGSSNTLIIRFLWVTNAPNFFP